MLNISSVYVAVLCILLFECVQNAEILEPSITQYTMIQKNVTFTCKTTGREAYWILNGIPMTITYPDQIRYYENQGIVFMEESSQDYYNLSMIIYASSALNNTVTFCSVIGSDYTLTMSHEVYMVAFNTLRPYQPTVTVNISYNTSSQGKQSTMIVMITEVPRWPGYRTSEFKMDISNVSKNIKLSQLNISEPGNGTIVLRTSLLRSITNCSLIRVTLYAMSEVYGKSEPTKEYVEQFKSARCLQKSANKLHIYHWHRVGKAAGELDTLILMDGPYFHLGAWLVSRYIDGLDKDQNYFIQVQVDSISGSSLLHKHHFDTHYRITEHELAGTITQARPGILGIKESSDSIAFGVSLALISLLLATVSIILFLFCVYHYKSISQRSQLSTSTMGTEYDSIMMSSTETAVTDKKC